MKRGLRLIALIASFALAAAALAHFLDTGAPINIVAWFVGAIIGHDLILFPLYAALDRIAGRLEPKTRVPVVNHIRVPALLSGLLLLVYFPLILRLSAPVYEKTTGLNPQVYLGRWLAITAALFVVSAVAYAVRLRLTRRSAPRSAPSAGPGTAPHT
jgi:hypothetical protein